VQKTLPPSNVRSRLHNLVARDDINSYLDLVWVAYDDLELVVIFLMISHGYICVDICVDMMVGLDVSHGSMYIMNFF